MMRVLAMIGIILVGLVMLACRGEDPAGAGDRGSSAGDRSAEASGQVSGPASEKTARDRSVAASCLLDRGGCARTADTIEPCGDIEDLAPVTLEQVLKDPASYSGKTIAVRGPLAKSGADCTERSCEDTCCNACTAMVTVGDPRGPDHIRLESTTRPGRYSCIGDESMTCCEIEPRGQEVVAQGVFHVVAGLEPVIHQLWTSEFCVP